MVGSSIAPYSLNSLLMVSAILSYNHPFVCDIKEIYFSMPIVSYSSLSGSSFLDAFLKILSFGYSVYRAKALLAILKQSRSKLSRYLKEFIRCSNTDKLIRLKIFCSIQSPMSSTFSNSRLYILVSSVSSSCSTHSLCISYIQYR
ncbi:hypothetical protein D3C87_1581610 [compost metagenome]